MPSVNVNPVELCIRIGIASCLLLGSFGVQAEALNPPPPPAIGSTNVAIADLLVSRPGSSPCIVTLLNNQEFADFSDKPFRYTPPAACPGPWSKVIFEADMSVTQGVQYDRTSYIQIGGVNVFFGTTSEPSSTVGPSWHVERDLTDYSSLFFASQSGAVSLGNIFDSTYTGDIFGTFTLEFYPVDSADPAPVTANSVLPLAPGYTSLATGTSLLSQTFTLPTNIENAYLDVMAQSQGNDEFWYTCVPNDVSAELYSCGGSAFREVEITIDGQAAGVAPVYPWIYTGGIDPFLWAPTPGVQTLDFLPYRIDLTPFAGVLSNGQPHTVALSVYNADNSFAVSGNLLLYLDSGSTLVSGAVTSNSLSAAPMPSIKENLLNGPNGGVKGNILTGAQRQFAITGYVTSSKGTITTAITQTIDFSNSQEFTVSPASYVQRIEQTTTVTSKTTTTNGSAVASKSLQLSYPLSLGIDETIGKSGISVATSVKQSYLADLTATSGTGVNDHSSLLNTVSPSDTLHFDTSGNFLGHTGNQNTQHYVFSDSTVGCYDRTISSLHGAVSKVSDVCKSTTASVSKH